MKSHPSPEPGISTAPTTKLGFGLKVGSGSEATATSLGWLAISLVLAASIGSLVTGGASVGAGRNLEVTVDLADALFDAGYALNLDAAAEDMPESPRDVSVPLTTSGAGKTVAGRRYVASFRYGP